MRTALLVLATAVGLAPVAASACKKLSTLVYATGKDAFLTVEIEGAGAETHSFNRTDVAKTPYSDAAIEGDAGLADAIEKLRGLLDELPPVGETVFEDPVALTPALGGRVHVAAAGADGKPPAIVRQQDDSGSFEFSTGAYWARLDGQWFVVAN